MTTRLELPGKAVKLQDVAIPNISVKDLLSAIPAHCYKRSAIRSGSYVLWDFFLLSCFYKAVTAVDPLIDAFTWSQPLKMLARISLWSIYGFAAGLVGTGIWILAHECGHQAFSESKTLNSIVGWLLHSSVGVPYHSWRISHAKHHAQTSHMTEDQAFVPRTRSDLKLPAFNADQEALEGSRVSSEVMHALHEALGDSPISTALGVFKYLLIGWPAYLLCNASGQHRYPKGTNHFNPNSKSIFRDNQYGQVVLSDMGVVLWLGALTTFGYYQGFLEVFRVYLVPYLWVNHWIVLITFLQHTDPVLPHYRAAEHTFPRGALSTLDRTLLGDLGSIAGWIGETATHGISATHVVHHVSSKIPHYHAWEATYALRARLAQDGIQLEGRPGGWAEVYRVYRACQFVEDEGDILFYKNAYGLAAAKPAVVEVTDSSLELDRDSELESMTSTLT